MMHTVLCAFWRLSYFGHVFESFCLVRHSIMRCLGIPSFAVQVPDELDPCSCAALLPSAKVILFGAIIAAFEGALFVPLADFGCLGPWLMLKSPLVTSIIERCQGKCTGTVGKFCSNQVKEWYFAGGPFSFWLVAPAKMFQSCLSSPFFT
jgi:hypothetical protein